jgi:hypothetical protein
VSEYLLLGIRPSAPGEVSLAGVARDVVTLAAWHAWLHRWGLLRSFGVLRDPAAELRACLVIRASGQAAAERLAAKWGQLSGYRVTVVPLSAIRLSVVPLSVVPLSARSASEGGGR